MKHLNFFTIALILSSLSYGQFTFAKVTEYLVQKSDKSIERTITVQIDGVTAKKSEITPPADSDFNGFKAIELKLKGAVQNHFRKIGNPMIPVVRFIVEGSVSVTVDQNTVLASLPTNTVIRPATESVLKKPGQKVKVKFNREAYNNPKFYPSQAYTITPSGSINGKPQYLVTLFPVSVQTSTGKYITRPNYVIKTTSQSDLSKGSKPLVAFIVGSKFEKSLALQEYIKLKQSLGFDTAMGIMGKDFSTDLEIRAWLKAKLQNNLKYAIVIGDIQDVPAHQSKIIRGFTDHFYRAIDTSNYDTDINGPDIGVGRLSVNNENQLIDVLAKLTRYQKGSFQSQAWLKNIAFLATDDRYEVAEGTHNYAIDSYTSKKGYAGFFPSVAEAKGGDKLYAITHKADTANVVKALNDGRSIVNYSGHGATTYWDGPSLTQADVRGLSNRDALPFVISNACITAQISVEESFGETWLRHPAGAIAFWGSFDNTYWDEDDILERRMYDGIFKNGKVELGSLTEFALTSVWQEYGGENKSAYYWETYFLLGDPSIKLRLQ